MEFIRKEELMGMLDESIEYWKDKDDCTLITLLGVVDDVNKLPTIDSETVIYPSRPKGTIDIEDLKPVEYKPITEDIILTPEQMSLYYMGYVDGMKWLLEYLQKPEIRRPITDKEWDQFFESISRTNKEDEEG